MNVEFVDTNILVYGLDSSSPSKHLAARSLLERLWEEGTGAVSVQVLQEFLWVVTKRVSHPLSLDAALSIVEDYLAWEVFIPSGEDVLLAGRLARDTSVSFWDAMVVHAAASVGAPVLWSEDLNNGQMIAGVRIQNPFLG